MKEVWEQFLAPHLPVNVRLTLVDNPIRSTYELLGKANESGSIDSFSVYSDPDDILERFPAEKQKKYFGGLVGKDLVKFVGIPRVGEMDVSATQARKLLQHGMKDAFMQLLPEVCDREGVWNFLLLKSFVHEIE